MLTCGLEEQGNVEERRQPSRETKEITEIAREQTSFEDDATRSKGLRCYFEFDQYEENEQWECYAERGDRDGSSPRDVAPAVQTEEQGEYRTHEYKSTQEVYSAEFGFPIDLFCLWKLEYYGHADQC